MNAAPQTSAASATQQGHHAAIDRRWVWTWLALALPAALVVTDTWLAIAQGWWFESRLDQLAALAAGVWLVVVSAALLIPAGRSLLTRNAAQLIALVVSLSLAWLVAELLIGPLLGRIGDPFHGWRPNTKMVNHPTVGVMRDVAPEATVTFNSWGVRGDEPPPREQTYRVLCVGASSTACTYLDDASAWPRATQTALNELPSEGASKSYWVGNARVPGFRSDEHRKFVETSHLVNDVDGLVIQMGVNDFMSCLLGPQPKPPVWTHSRVWQLVRKLTRGLLDSGTMVEDAAGEVYNRRRAARQAADAAKDLPPLDDCLGHFADNLRAMIAAATRRGVRLIFTTQPVLWRADLSDVDQRLLWFGRMVDGRFLSVDQLRDGMDRYNQTLREVCGKEGVELVDLDDLNGDPAVFYDDCHFTDTGSARVAQRVARWLAEHEPLPGATMP